MTNTLSTPAARPKSLWRRLNDALLLMDSDPHDYVNARLRALEQTVDLLQAPKAGNALGGSTRPSIRDPAVHRS